MVKSGATPHSTMLFRASSTTMIVNQQLLTREIKDLKLLVLKAALQKIVVDNCTKVIAQFLKKKINNAYRSLTSIDDIAKIC